MASKVLNIFTGFIMRSVFIATLGAEYTGISSLFTDLLHLLSFAELGISSAIAYSLYKPIAEGDNRKISALMQFYKSAYRIVALAVLVMGLAMIPFMDILVPAEKIGAEVRDEVSKHLILIFMLYVANSAVSYLQVYKATLLSAHQERRKISWIQMIMAFVKLVVECAILLIMHKVVTENRIIIYLTYLIAGIIITRVTNGIISAYTTKRYPEVDYNTKERLSKEEKKKLYKDVGALMIYKVCHEVNVSLDSIITSAMFGTLYVGYVSNYRLVTNKVRVVIMQFFNSATPSLGNLAAEKDAEYQYKTFRSLQFMSFWVACFCATSFVALLNPFIYLWLRNAEFVLSLWLPIVLVAVFYSHIIMAPVNSLRTANGLFVQGKYRPIFLCVVNVAFSIGLGYLLGNGGKDPVMGIVGIKLATLISHIATSHWYDPMLIYKHVFKKPLKSYFITIGGQLVIAIGCGVITYGLGWLLFGSGHPTDGFAGIFPNMPLFVAFIIKGILCLVVPNAIVWLVYRKTEEYKHVSKVIKDFFGKLLNKLKKKKSTTEA